MSGVWKKRISRGIQAGIRDTNGTWGDAKERMPLRFRTICMKKNLGMIDSSKRTGVVLLSNYFLKEMNRILWKMLHEISQETLDVHLSRFDYFDPSRCEIEEIFRMNSGYRCRM